MQIRVIIKREKQVDTQTEYGRKVSINKTKN